MSVMRNHAHYKDISVTGIISSKNAARPEGQLRDGKKDKKKDKKDKDAPPALAPGDKKRGKSGQANPAVAGPSKSTPAPAAAATPAPATGVKPATAGSKKSRKRGGPADSSSSASTEPAPVPAPAQSSTTPVTPLSSQQSAPVETKPQSDAAPTRRGRPTLGLASRQFAAALSGAGVQAKKSERNVSVVAESGATVASSDTSPSVEIVSRGGGRGRGRGRAGGRGGAA
jgi:regulator of nonsense transcripts 3